MRRKWKEEDIQLLIKDKEDYPGASNEFFDEKEIWPSQFYLLKKKFNLGTSKPTLSLIQPIISITPANNFIEASLPNGVKLNIPAIIFSKILKDLSK